MASPSQKVYVIHVPSPDSGPSAGPAASRTRPPSGDRTPAPTVPAAVPPRPWARLLSALLLGPVAAVRWLPTPPRRHRWLAISAVCLAAAVTLVGRGWPLLAGTVSSSGGVLKWLLIVPTLGFALAAVWARGLGLVMSSRSARFPEDLPWLRHPGVIGAAGIVLPGLGLLLTGHTRRGAWTFGLLAPLVAASLVLLHAPWLWAHRAVASKPGISGPALETVFLIAGAWVVVIAFAWIIQALDGLRRASPAPSPRVSGFVSAGLLAAWVGFGLGFRPADVAGRLDSVSANLERGGWRVVPLLLSESATRLDPATPRYLARTADLYVALGRGAAAHARRDLLAERARAWEATAARAGRGAAVASPVRGGGPESWEQVAALFR